MQLPDNCIKGIPNKDFVIEDGNVAAHLFNFDSKHNRPDDDLCEQSINWQDDEDAIEFTLKQKKDDGTIQFKAGAAIIPREEIDRLSKLSTVKEVLSYERRKLDNNPYHGNLLLKKDVPKPTMRMIAASLALLITDIRSLP